MTVCGIAGLISCDSSGIESRLDAMLKVQNHRGPDDRGQCVDGLVGLGQVRLSILDLSPAGHQPMLLDGGRLSIVFNGEIYNFIEIKRELEGRGHVFRSSCDTEVILHAYDEWGVDCVERFNGMWGFALWDRARSRLFCSRDRLGVKPFYYSTHRDEFVFGSEIKVLLAATASLSEPNDAYIARFLRTSQTDFDERTFFRSVLQLKPAHSMTIQVGAAGPAVERQWAYWSFDADRVWSTYDYTDPAAQVRSLLEDSVRLRLRADVPIGTCLSGGLDSSSIVALASRQLDGPVWTFSALYPQKEYDETRFVREMNEKFPTIPHEVWPQPGDLLSVMPSLVWHQDEPAAGPGLYSQWHVMQMAAGKVTVLLDGQGADEMLGGYHPYYLDYLQSRIASTARHPSAASVARLGKDWRSVSSRVGGSQTRSIATTLARQALARHLSEGVKSAIRSVRPASAKPEVSEDYVARFPMDDDPWRVEGPFGDRLANVLYDATLRTSVPSLLRYEDRNSMAFSIEARTPFLDYRLVEYSLGLPFDERIDGEWTKSVLRRAMDGTLPPDITWRRDKMGYPTPFAIWLRGPFKEAAESIIYSDEFRRRGIFEPSVVDALWRQHLSGEADNSWNVWRWLNLELWFREFIDPSSSVRFKSPSRA